MGFKPLMMINNLPLVSWGSGVVMIAVFVLVCIGLTATVLALIMGGSKKKKN